MNYRYGNFSKLTSAVVIGNTQLLDLIFAAYPKLKARQIENNIAFLMTVQDLYEIACISRLMTWLNSQGITKLEYNYTTGQAIVTYGELTVDQQQKSLYKNVSTCNPECHPSYRTSTARIQHHFPTNNFQFIWDLSPLTLPKLEQFQATQIKQVEKTLGAELIALEYILNTK